jgi:hypothetical protein
MAHVVAFHNGVGSGRKIRDKSEPFSPRVRVNNGEGQAISEENSIASTTRNKFVDMSSDIVGGFQENRTNRQVGPSRLLRRLSMLPSQNRGHLGRGIPIPSWIRSPKVNSTAVAENGVANSDHATPVVAEYL